ncbi:MAG: hypothetical protein HKL92_03050 [Candidatus Eremiobacteraeota bacterium]|nr:hypothetical protein [Candidatus Eremiobacteraeota bacterium]
MTEFALRELHATIRFFMGWGGAVLIVGILAFVYLHHATAPAGGTLAATKPSTAAAIAREIQGAILADRLVAAARGTTPMLAAPAVNVVREIPGMRGFSGAEIAAILGALKPKTVEVIGAHLDVPTPAPSPTAPPGWTSQQQSSLFATDVAATESVLSNPKTKIAVSVTRAPVPPTRIGSIFTTNGAGLGYAAVRKGQFELDLGAALHGAHLSPIIAPSWLVPHTQLGLGVGLTYDHGLKVGVAATVHF